MSRKKDKYYFRKEKKKRGHIHVRLMRVLDFIIFPLTIIFGAALISAYLAKHISPADIWIFAFAGLVAPTLYIVNIVFILYWAIRWKMIVIVPAVAVLVGISNISLFFRPAFSKEFNDPKLRQTIVISYNVMGFLTEENNGKVVSSIDSVTAFIGRHKPDILCIQEFQAKSAGQKNRIDSLIGMKYNTVNYKVKNTAGGGWGLAIYSRYPIVSSDAIDYPDSNNSSLWVDVAVGADTIRVFNNHLQTTSVDGSDREYITTEAIQKNPVRDKRVRGIVSKLKRNYMKRAAQADTLSPIIKESPYKVIVTGDFNDTPMSYAYSKIRGELADTFVEKGRGMTTNTYKGLFNMFRIDYILHSKEIQTRSYATPASDYSDHKPVIAGLGINGN